MNLRIGAICLYIASIYWLSLKYPALHTLFFPTLGAFSLLFISRPFGKSELGKIAFGATIAAIIGSLLVSWNAGVIPFLLNTLIMIGLINRFKWNAPPILAVSFIPFFTQDSTDAMPWVIPLSVCVSLLGLLLVLAVVFQIEKISGLKAKSVREAVSTSA